MLLDTQKFQLCSAATLYSSDLVSTITATSLCLPGERDSITYQSRLFNFMQNRHRDAKVRDLESRAFELKQFMQREMDGKKVRLLPTGDCEIQLQSGKAIAAAELEYIWSRYGGVLARWLQWRCDQINNELEVWRTSHHDLVKPASLLPQVFAPNPRKKPSEPDELAFPAEPQHIASRAKWWDVLIPVLGWRRLVEDQEDKKAHQKALLEWEEACADAVRERLAALEQYQQDLTSWKQLSRRHEAYRYALQRNFTHMLSTDAAAMEKICQKELKKLFWPSDMDAKLKIDLDDRKVLIEVNLAEQINFPKVKAQLKENQRGIALIPLSREETRLGYEEYVYGTILKLSSIVFAVLPQLECVDVRGYATRLSLDEGEQSDCIIESSISVADMNQLVELQSAGETAKSLCRSLNLRTSLNSPSRTGLNLDTFQARPRVVAL